MPRSERDIIIQSLGIAADSHQYDRDLWKASKNPALEPVTAEAEEMRAECEALRDRLIGLPEWPSFVEGDKSCG